MLSLLTSQPRKQRADVLTLRKALVYQIVRPELVGAVGVRVEAADCREQAGLRGGRHRDAVRARGRAERVQRVVELLRNGFDSRKILNDH